MTKTTRPRLPIALFGCVLLLACLASPSAARADSMPTVVVMAFGNYSPPFYVCGKNGPRAGLFVDFLEAFEAGHPQYDIQRVTLPRKRISHALRQGEVDAFALNSPLFVPQGEREDYLFSLPIWRACDHVATLKGRPFDYQGPQSLKGRTVGLVLGNGYGQLEPLLESGEIKAERAQGELRLLRMLASGYLDLAVLNDHTARAIMRREGIPEDDVRFCEPPVYCFSLSVQVRREQARFLEDLNAFILESRADGLLDRLAARRMGD